MSQQHCWDIFLLLTMKKALLFFFSFLCLTVFSQDTLRTFYSGGQPKEVYTVNQAKEKEGDYVHYTRYGTKYISGHYKNGEPIGLWEFYSSDVNGYLVQKLDFDTHKETYVDSLRVPSLICGPRYFGGNMLQQEYIQRRIRTDFKESERQEMKGKIVSVNFSIDPKTLKPVGIECTDGTVTPEMRAQMVKIVSEMPAWLQPVCKSTGETQPIPVWRFTAVFVF
jgi:hypothetical protein